MFRIFQTELTPAHIYGRSPQSHAFLRSHRRHLDAVLEKIDEVELSVLVWAPRIPDAEKRDPFVRHLEGIEDRLKRRKITPHLRIDGRDGHKPADPAELSRLQRAADVTFVFIAEPDALDRFDEGRFGASENLFIVIDLAVQPRFSERFPDLAPQTEAYRFDRDFPNRVIPRRVTDCLAAIRAAGYFADAALVRSGAETRTGNDYLDVYRDLKSEIDLLLHQSSLFVLSFIRYLGAPGSSDFHRHLDVATDDLAGMLDFLTDQVFIRAEGDYGSHVVARRGDRLLSILSLDRIPTLAEEQKNFASKWWFGIDGTFKTAGVLFAQSNSLDQAASNFYFSWRRRPFIIRWLMSYLSGFRDAMSPAESAFWNHPLTGRLFGIWQDTIAGRKSGFWVSSRERAAFFRYMYKKVRIAHDPKYSKIYENYKTLIFSFRMLRPNVQAHIYLCFSFIIRPLKELIRQYLNASAITGQYDFLLSRFPPYHNLLNIYASRGERTSFDLRDGLDIRPITYRLDTKFALAPSMHKTQTRKDGCFITCPVIKDEAGEREKAAEVAKMEEDIKWNLPSPAYLGNIDVSEDGRVMFMGTDPPEEIPMYGPRRANFIQNQDRLNLLKAIPRPSRESGLIIHFNILDPVTVLLNGIYGERDASLMEIIYLIKVMDLYMPEARKDINERRGLNDIIADAFDHPEPRGLSDDKRAFIREIARLQTIDPSEERAWKYFTTQLIEGRDKFLLQAICRGLTRQGFDVVFSIWPLLTGNEITISEDGDVKQKEVAGVKENRLPLLVYLKRELEDLLHNVFSRFLDVSAATRRIRSEPRLASLVVEGCINLKLDRAVFRERLKEHLTEHYRTHFKFIREYLGVNRGVSEDDILGKSVIDIHKLRMIKLDNESEREINPRHAKLIQLYPGGNEPIPEQGALSVIIEEIVDHDTEGIYNLVEGARTRLVSSGENNYLLRFLDPESIDIHLGHFQYEGDMIDREEGFISEDEERQNKLGVTYFEKEAQLADRRIELDKGKFGIEKDINVLKKKKDKRIQEAIINTEVNRYRLKESLSEIDLKIAEGLKNGDFKEYAVLTLINAHRSEGIDGVERILSKSPHLLAVICPEVYHETKVHELKHETLDVIRQRLGELDPMTIAALFTKDYKDIVTSRVYKDVSKNLSEALKNIWKAPYRR